MSRTNHIREFLDILSEFSVVERISDGKKIEYALPNLCDGGMPDLEKIKKLAKPSEIKISNDVHQVILIF
jgi:hypothetical protein